jgi:hypothetical protein
VNIEEHPDLQDLRLSKRDERKARAVARAQARQAFGMAREPGFLRRHRGSVLAVGVVAALVVVIAVMDRTGGSGVTESSPSTTQTVMEEKPGVDLSQPFLDTPAAGWANGEAGIVAPAPTQVGSYSPEAVAAGYARARQAVITARLDRAVLEGHDFERYLTLLAPGAQAQIRPDYAPTVPDAYFYTTRVADGFHLLPVQPKVLGGMWAEQDAEGALLIHTNYIFAYAFDPGDAHIVNVLDMVTVDRMQADYRILDGTWATSDQGLWPGSVQAYGYAVACHAYDKGFLAPAYSEPNWGGAGPGTDKDKKNAFDPKASIPTTSTCRD